MLSDPPRQLGEPQLSICCAVGARCSLPHISFVDEVQRFVYCIKEVKPGTAWQLMLTSASPDSAIAI